MTITGEVAKVFARGMGLDAGAFFRKYFGKQTEDKNQDGLFQQALTRAGFRPATDEDRQRIRIPPAWTDELLAHVSVSTKFGARQEIAAIVEDCERHL